MKSKLKNKTQFVVDPALLSKDQSELLIRVLQEEKIKFLTSANDLDEDAAVVFF